MKLASLLLTRSVVFPILVSYLVAVRYLEHRHGAAGRFGVIGRRWPAQRITGSRLRWIKADELKRLIDADPELVVFHLLDDDPAEAGSKRFETEISVTLPQLEEALPWMPRGTRFAVYRVDGIALELTQRLSGMTQDREVLLLAGRFSPASERFDRRFAGQILS
ncbi:MAG: hypothetical protein WBE76_13880 [Terracidiphilus sp.]